MLSALKELGFDITVAGMKTDWVGSSSAMAPLAEFKQRFTPNVRLYEDELTKEEQTLVGRLCRIYGLFKKEPKYEFLERVVYAPRKKVWFSRIADEASPDIIFTTYLKSALFMDHAHFKRTKTVMDSIDLFTLNQRMWNIVEPYLLETPLSIHNVADEVLELDFIDRFNLKAAANEFKTYDQYDHTLAIVRREEVAIKANTQHTKVQTIPMMQDTVDVGNTYAGVPFLPIGPNPYNLQGLLYLMKKVLPLVRASAPSFSIRVGGNIENLIVPEPGISLVGFVSAKSEYTDACFMPCPVYTGTGQQVKITEAMAHGVPVVALQDAAERAGVRHGETGLVARNADEFAEYMLRLWNDRALCRTLGKNAKELIAAEYALPNLVKLLSNIVR